MVRQGVALFDRLVVAVGTNADKRYTFTSDERVAMLRESLTPWFYARYEQQARSNLNSSIARLTSRG
jgi:phosphopantetheine adenylyltransferase